MSSRASAWRSIGERAIAMPARRCAIPKSWRGRPAGKASLRLIFTEMGVTRRVRARALAELEEPSVKEMLSDPIVHAVMHADGVHAGELEALLCSVAKRL